MDYQTIKIPQIEVDIEYQTALAVQGQPTVFEQDPEFFRFQRTLEAYQEFLTQNSTIVLPASGDLFEFLQSSSPNNSQ